MQLWSDENKTLAGEAGRFTLKKPNIHVNGELGTKVNTTSYDENT